MFRIRRAAAALALAALAGCGGGEATLPSARAALDELVAAERAFAALASDSAAQHAFLSFIAPDAILFRPGPVPGSQVLEAQPMPAALALIWDPAWADVSAAGDLGYTTGPWRSGRRGSPPDSLPGAGQYVTLWRRTPDGFRFVLDAGIAHAPAFAELPAHLERAAPPAGPPVGAESTLVRESLFMADQDLGGALGQAGATAYRPYAAERVRVLRDGTGPAFGPDALIAASPPVSFETVPGGAEVAASGDLGYTYGEVRARADTVGVPMGYYVRIWRRQPDGSWKVVLDLVSAPPR